MVRVCSVNIAVGCCDMMTVTQQSVQSLDIVKIPAGFRKSRPFAYDTAPILC
jgi:hypothetical protein